MSSSYEDLAALSWDEIPESQLLPSGHWRLAGRGLKFLPGKSGASAVLLVFYEAKVPLEDVDEDALADLGNDYSWSDNRIPHRFYWDTASDMRRVRDHLTMHIGFVFPKGPILDLTGDLPRVPKELQDAFRGAQIVGEIGRRSYTNGAGEHVEENTIKSFAKVEV